MINFINADVSALAGGTLLLLFAPAMTASTGLQSALSHSVYSASAFVIRLKFRDGVRVPPHWHPIDEHLTVMTGTLHVGMGEKFDRAAATALPAGSYSLMPKEMRHFMWAEGETTIQLHGIGPFKTFWVNPADDPNKKTESN